MFFLTNRIKRYIMSKNEELDSTLEGKGGENKNEDELCTKYQDGKNPLGKTPLRKSRENGGSK